MKKKKVPKSTNEKKCGANERQERPFFFFFLNSVLILYLCEAVDIERLGGVT